MILIVNLFLGLLTIAMSVVVLSAWLPHTKSEEMSAHRLLLIGIALSFTATIGDNIYWGLTWLSQLKHWNSEPEWFAGGPYANLVFRHCVKIVAGACHVEAARRAGIIRARELSILAAGCAVVVVWLFVAIMASPDYATSVQ